MDLKGKKLQEVGGRTAKLGASQFALFTKYDVGKIEEDTRVEFGRDETFSKIQTRLQYNINMQLKQIKYDNVCLIYLALVKNLTLGFITLWAIV